VKNNTIVGNPNGNISIWGSVVFNNNNIYNNGGGKVLNKNALGTPDLNAENNYWGTDDASVIAAKVYDWNEDSSLGFVDYSPHKDGIIISNPITPPSGLTVAKSGATMVQLDWSANAESDVVSYKVYYDVDETGWPYANSITSDSEPPSYTLTSLTQGVTYYIAVAAVDSDGNESWVSKESETITDGTDWETSEPVNEPRVFTSAGVTSANEGSAYSYSITTADPDGDSGDPLILSGTSLPDWLTLVDNGDGTGTLSGSPNSGDIGDHEIRLDLSTGTKLTHIYSNVGAFAALKPDGSVVTWGRSGLGGDSGVDSGGTIISSVADNLSSGVTRIYSNNQAFAALKADGSVVTWGTEHFGGGSSAVAGWKKHPPPKSTEPVRCRCARHRPRCRLRTIAS
jgi:hypothetical protein